MLVPFLIYFLFLLTLGPPLPYNLKDFSMLEIHEDLYVFKDIDFGGDRGAIYKLSCCSDDCKWSIIYQELKEITRNQVAIHVPDSFCT